jgi:DNA-binding beta-propeller fold protein YncE
VLRSTQYPSTGDCARQTPPTIPLPRSLASATFDAFTGSLYVTNINDPSVSLIDTATCNAMMLAGCRRVAHEVVVGSGPEYTGFDPAEQTLYVPNFLDGTVSLVGIGH